MQCKGRVEERRGDKGGMRGPGGSWISGKGTRKGYLGNSIKQPHRGGSVLGGRLKKRKEKGD